MYLLNDMIYFSRRSVSLFETCPFAYQFTFIETKTTFCNLLKKKTIQPDALKNVG